LRGRQRTHGSKIQRVEEMYRRIRAVALEDKTKDPGGVSLRRWTLRGWIYLLARRRGPSK
jgi:hypothetical protein